MQPISRVAARSAANLFALWYVFWGLVGAIAFLLSTVENCMCLLAFSFRSWAGI